MLILCLQGISASRDTIGPCHTRESQRAHHFICRFDPARARDVPSTRGVRPPSCCLPWARLTSILHRRPLGAIELVTPLLHLSSLSTPLLSTTTHTTILGPNDVEPFIQDLVRRFEPDDELDGVLGPVVVGLCHHESLFKPEGLASGDAGWRGIVGGLEVLVSNKSVANMIPRLDAWNPEGATASNFETVSLLGPLLRLGVFQREWVRPFCSSVFSALSYRKSSRLSPHRTSRKRKVVRARTWNQPLRVCAAL